MEKPRHLDRGGLVTDAQRSTILPVPLPSQESTTVSQATRSISGRLRINFRRPDPLSNGTTPVDPTAAGFAGHQDGERDELAA